LNVCLEHSAFVATPQVRGEQIAHLLRFEDGATLYDPTCGEGDLLLPFADQPDIQLYGVEISRERALEARQRLPEATILTSAVEAVRVTPRSMSAVVANPPYFFVDGRRAEYRVIVDAGATLLAGGVMVAILPARSAWDGTMINHWSRCYSQVRCWKFPDGSEDDPASFQKYTQIVVVGVRRAIPLEAPDPLDQRRFKAWRWKEGKDGASPWVGGTPPPDLPSAPIEDPYLVPAAGTIVPDLVALHADDALLLEALESSGVHTTPEWTRATTWEPDAGALPPLMPLLGETHQAAEILTGLLDSVPLTGPEGERCIFTSFVSQKWTEVEVEAEQLEEEREKGVTSMRIYRQADHPVLGALNLLTGAWRYYQGEEVYGFLAPWLRVLASRVFEKRRPLYQLDPEAWELAVCGPIGVDKQLPGASHAGLAAAQLHRVFAMGRALDLRSRVAEQADPGTGKTRQATALAARQAEQWRRATERRKLLRSGAYQGSTPAAPPAWTRRLRLAWQRTPRAQALLGPGQEGPAALPVLVLTPRRVMPTWQYEITHAWPDAEVMVLDQHTDIDRWMQRCTETRAPAVIGVMSHGLSRAFGRCWKPAVLERVKKQVVNDAEPPEALLPELERVQDQRGRFQGFRFKETGAFFTKTIRVSHFFCPDCGKLVMAVPEGKARRGKKGEEDTLEAVTSLAWFKKQPRQCRHCAFPLWSEMRVIPKAKEDLSQAELIRQGYRGLPFAAWEQAVARSRQKASGGKTVFTLARPALAPTFALRPGGKLPRPRAEGEADTRFRSAVSGQRLGKACRTPQARIDRKACRLITAQGERRGMRPDSFSPPEYLHQFYRGCVAFTVVDESHNGRGAKTDIGHSFHLAQLASQGIVYASGTQYSGKLTDFFHYWFRFHPQFWKQLGLGWNDAEWAMRIYGVVEQQVREHEEEARRGSGQTDVTVTNVPAPGISAKLLPHLMADLVFLGVLDVGAFMPPRVEVPIVVPMVDPALETALAPAKAAHQEAKQVLDAASRHLKDLAETIVAGGAVTEAALLAAREDGAAAEARFEEANADLTRVQGWVHHRDLPTNYENIVTTLSDAAKEGNSGAAMAKATIPRWWSVLPCVEPRFTVTHTLRDTWGDVLGTETILTTPLLAADYRYPLEVRLHQEVARELEAGNVTMVYFEQNGDEAKGQRSLAPRLAWVLREFHPWTLANTVEAEDREDAIRAAAQAGHRCLIVPYRRVQEGLNLQDCIDTILWAEMALNFFALDQASRRHWRMGRKKAAKLIYVVYANSEGHAKLCRLAHQSGAASAFAGEPARGALVEHVGADRTMLSRLGSSLEAMEEETPALASQEELEAAFARRGEELERTLKQGRQWAGYVDTLPERLIAFHAARLQPALVVEAEPALVERAPELPAAWQLVEWTSADVEEEAQGFDPEADVLTEVLAHEHPGMLRPARAGRETPVGFVANTSDDVIGSA
jgi:hypothetical protein